MKCLTYTLASVALSVLTLAVGCASAPLFPMNGGETIQSETAFGMLTATPDTYEGRAIKLAGRIVGVETTEHGALILAEWLPYPRNERQGPEPASPAARERFAMFYPGTIDEEGKLHGNKFLVVGKVTVPSLKKETRGVSATIPRIMARCLHVWKTGSAELSLLPDVENTGYPIAQQTYCAKT